MKLEQRSIEGLKEWAQAKIDRGVKPTICGSNGGDGVHYKLSIGGGAWGDGEVYLVFTNKGYLDKPDDFRPYDDSIGVRVY